MPSWPDMELNFKELPKGKEGGMPSGNSFKSEYRHMR